ncbi:hypothetical protein Pfl04_44690 [Planosporangium flavigriseum]|uniref:Uncharacterized protein n=1 Tax=Planosporangium flavigriseum TaxID=373681 RepID=A0A8J3M3B2_9ACTN|nr:hypothetical protein Pfl04_44690 [Planosporangium flavigriseum]
MLATIAAALAAGSWIGAAVVTAGHGFDVTDEGYYLLSYRWWSTNLRAFSGAQYLYGPVFQLLGYDIAGLRLFRLFTVVAVHLLFGWTFMRWLRLRRPDAPASRWWEIAGTAAIVACGGMIYSWLPLSPGYNDVSLLGALLLGAVVMRMAADVDRGRAVPAWVAAALGPVAVGMLLAKWASAGVILAFITVIAVVVVAQRGPREVARLAAWALASALITAAVFQVLVVPLTAAVPEMLETNRLIAARAYAPTVLLTMYVTSGYQLFTTIVTDHAVLLLAALFAVVARGRVGRLCAGVAAALGLAVSSWRLVTDGNLFGGAVNIERFPVAVLLVLTVALLVGVVVRLHRWRAGTGAPRPRWERRRGVAIIGMLALLPVLQAAGTNNALHFVAVNGFASWAALMVVVLTGIESTRVVARWLTGAVTAGAVALSASIGTSGLWSYPYRTAGYAVTTAPVAGVPALDSVRLDPFTAQAYSDFHQRLLPYIRPEGRAVMAFDEMAGVVLLLDGRPVGEAWYARMDQDRTAEGIRLSCPGGRGWWGDRAPVLIFGRPVRSIDIAALWSCGLQFPADYRLLLTPDQAMGLHVYVPKSDDAGR